MNDNPNEDIEEKVKEEELEEGPFTKPELYLRLLAKFIDLLIVGAFFTFPSIVGPLAGITYMFISDGLMGGQSLGKRIIGLRVVSTSRRNEPCDFKESVMRNSPFGAVLIAWLILGCIPYLGKPLVFLMAAAVVAYEVYLINYDITGLRLGDNLARTMVVPAKEV